LFQKKKSFEKKKQTMLYIYKGNKKEKKNKKILFMKMNVDTINRNDVNPIIRSHRQKRKKKLVFPFSKIYNK